MINKIFRDGDLKRMNKELPVADQAELLPYDGKWEFPRELLTLGNVFSTNVAIISSFIHNYHVPIIIVVSKTNYINPLQFCFNPRDDDVVSITDKFVSQIYSHYSVSSRNSDNKRRIYFTDKILGSGAFGIVRKAEARSICRGEAASTVAVKLVRAHAKLRFITALSRELKILVHIGKHPNIVNLLGACTQNVSYGEFG